MLSITLGQFGDGGLPCGCGCRVEAHPQGAGGAVRAAGPGSVTVDDHRALLAITDSPGYRWNSNDPLGTPTIVTYHFLEGADLPDPNRVAFGARTTDTFTAGQRDSFRQGADTFSGAAGLLFVEVDRAEDAMIGLHNVTGTPWAGFASYPYGTRDGITLGAATLVMDVAGAFLPGSWEFSVLIHELGHAVGLEHPHEGAFVLEAALDNERTTIMSYNEAIRPARAPAPLDVEALQHLYGPAMDLDGWTTEYDAAARTVSIGGGAADDVIIAPGLRMTAHGRGGDDQLVGRRGDDVLDGGEGDDRVEGQHGKDRLRGGLGNDWMSGGVDDDTVLGGEGADTLFGLMGDDVLGGGSGADMLRGGPGHDTLRAAAGREAVAGGDTLMGDQGNDSLIGGAGDDSLLGGDGRDVLDGGEGDDVLRSGTDDDTLRGGGGDDTLLADGWGTKRLEGGAGDDLLNHGSTFGTMWGGDGDDTLLGGHATASVDGGAGDDSLRGGGAWDEMQGGAGNDTLLGGGDLRGGNGDDLIVGMSAADDLRGGAGADTLVGGSGRDVLRGGGGNDALRGGGGHDTLRGVAGDDLLTGEGGRDVFVFSGGHDTIADWGDGETLRLDEAALGLAGLPLSRIARDATRAEDGAITFHVSGDASLTLLTPPSRLARLADDVELF